MKMLEEVVNYNFIQTDCGNWTNWAARLRKVLFILSFECIGDAFDNSDNRTAEEG